MGIKLICDNPNYSSGANGQPRESPADIRNPGRAIRLSSDWIIAQKQDGTLGIFCCKECVQAVRSS